jgi:hypothetical protein
VTLPGAGAVNQLEGRSPVKRYWEHPESGKAPARGEDRAWSEAHQAAEELRHELMAVGDVADFVGYRVVRNVVGRPVVQLGTIDPAVARALAELLRTASTRTLYIVKGTGSPDPAE